MAVACGREQDGVSEVSTRAFGYVAPRGEERALAICTCGALVFLSCTYSLISGKMDFFMITDLGGRPQRARSFWAALCPAPGRGGGSRQEVRIPRGGLEIRPRPPDSARASLDKPAPSRGKTLSPRKGPAPPRLETAPRPLLGTPSWGKWVDELSFLFFIYYYF